MFSRWFFRLTIAAALMGLAVPSAFAQRCPNDCQVGTSTFACDKLCTAGVSCKASTTSDICPAKCTNGSGGTNSQICQFDSDCTNPSFPFCNFFGEGTITLCGSSGNDIIEGDGGNNVICGNAGDDVITGAGGADSINGGADDDTIGGGPGNDVIEGGDGFDVVTGGAGNDNISGNLQSVFTDDGGNDLDGEGNDDTIVGSGGDDVLAGGGGSDLIVGQGGRDVFRGGDGVDTLIGNYGGPTSNDVLGSLYCGGKGDDVILADGPGHQCIDGGADQAVSGSESDCVYINLPDDTDDHDVGTAINCANPSHGSTNGTLLGDTPDCNCD